MRRLFFVFASLLVGCTPADRDRLASGAWKASECSLFSAMGCAGQAVGHCSVEASGDFPAFGDCLVNKTQNCVGANLARCALSGIVYVAKTTNVAAGGVSCTTEENKALVFNCVHSQPLESEAQAVEAVARCWLEVCEED